MRFARLVNTPMRKRADIVLVERGYFSSRARAQAAIGAGLVRVSGVPLKKASDEVAETRRSRPDRPTPGRRAAGSSSSPRLTRSRSILAASSASTSALRPEASPSAATRGAATVVAVDVGRGQLDPRLAADPRVRSLEGLDARALTMATLGERPGAVVIDVSFISQRLVLPHVLEFASERAWLVSLIKPQFEVGKVDLVKGRVKNEAAARARLRHRARGH